MSKKEAKEKLIGVATKFLQNPDISNTPEDQVIKYLKAKGLTDEDIKIAKERAQKELEKQKEKENEKKKEQQSQQEYAVGTIQNASFTVQEFNEMIEKAKTTNILSLRQRQMMSINSVVFSLSNLKILIVSFNKIGMIPDQIEALKELKIFHAVGCQLHDDQISKQLYQITSLEELNLSRNNLIYQQEITQLNNLIILDLSHNQLLEIPEQIGNLKQLKLLQLQNNNISKIPEGIKELTNLQKLYLKDNLIQDEIVHQSDAKKVIENLCLH